MENYIYKKSKGLTDKEMTYCPGCAHGIIHKLVAESLEELDLIERTISIASVGCSVYSNYLFNTDGIQAAHGRAPAVATGVKRALPNSIVFTYQGDGDLASIGIAEIIHAAQRNENITVIFVNNAIYGMTGGQMAPTTLEGQITTTTPAGRDVKTTGMPLKVSELLSTIDTVRYIERVSVHNPGNVRKAKKAIKKAFECQVNNEGFTLIEVLGTCNIGWGVTPAEALKFVDEKMVPYFPLGIIKGDKDGK